MRDACDIYSANRNAPADTYECSGCRKIVDYDKDWATEIEGRAYCSDCLVLTGSCDFCGRGDVLDLLTQAGAQVALCRDCMAKEKPERPAITSQRYRVTWESENTRGGATHERFDPMRELATRLGNRGHRVEFSIERAHGDGTPRTSRLISSWSAGRRVLTGAVED